MKFTYDDYLDNLCTTEQYRQQFNPVKLELNKIYIQAKDTYHTKHYIILFINENVALGKCIYNKISNKFIGDYQLFNVKDGWAYQDTRTLYRLCEEVK